MSILEGYVINYFVKELKDCPLQCGNIFAHPIIFASCTQSAFIDNSTILH